MVGGFERIVSITMNPSITCRTCILVLVILLGQALAALSDDEFGKMGNSDNAQPGLSNRLSGQDRLGLQCPVDHQLCPDAVGGGCCPNTRICGTNACLATIESAVTISRPKITEAPIFRRKLGSNKWDVVHENIQGRKRDESQCPASYQSCAVSLSGGCCPNNRICRTDSCYAASTMTATVCGQLGYVACGMAQGGGCCPQSYACQVDGCSPSAGVSNTETCSIGSYLCPASVGYGCCQDGFGCGLNSCYATSVSTFVFTETLTTTDAENLPHTVTSTITTASTPTTPTDIVSNTASNVIPKGQPTSIVTAIPKTDPTNDSSSSGLTKSQLGGIIGGAIALLVVLIVATYCIISRLNKVLKATTASKSRPRTTSSGQCSKLPRHTRPSASDIVAISIDPFMIAPSEASHPSQAHVSAHEVDGSSSSPPVFGIPFSQQSPPFNHYPRGYNPVPTSETNPDSFHRRNPSTEVTPPLGHKAGYFDIPPDLRDQNLRFGHTSPSRRPSQHPRNFSDVSNQSEISAVSSTPVELDAGTDGDRRSGLQRVLQGLGMGKISMRRKSSQSDSSLVAPAYPPTKHPEWGPGPNPGALGLGHIAEAGESRLTVEDSTQEMGEISLQEPQQARGTPEQKMIGRGGDVWERDQRSQ